MSSRSVRTQQVVSLKLFEIRYTFDWVGFQNKKKLRLPTGIANGHKSYTSKKIVLYSVENV